MNFDHYDTHQLRRYAADLLDLDDVPDLTWRKSPTRQYVLLWDRYTSAADRREIQERLVDWVREDVKTFEDAGVDTKAWRKATPPRVRAPSQLEPATEGDAITLRAQALCVYWAKLAEGEPEVRSFRKKVLGERVISAAEAGELITSPATSLIWPRYFVRRGVPIVGHTAEFDVSEHSNPFERPYRVRGNLHVAWPMGQAELPVHNAAPAPPEPMEVWNGNEAVLITPWPFSVMGELRKVASKLSERYTWDAASAAWFVLTNQPPWVPPLTWTVRAPDRVRNQGAITIKAAHWVPEEAVSRLYSKLKAQTKPTPTTSARRLALFRFVAERSSPIMERFVYGLDGPPWRSLQSQWNQEYPPSHEWHYTDLRNFRRDYREASKALIGY